MQNYKPTSVKQARALAVVKKMSATLVSILAYLFSKKAHQKFEQDVLDNPADDVESLATWLNGLLKELCLSVSIDGCNAAITKMCEAFAKCGSMARSGAAG